MVAAHKAQREAALNNEQRQWLRVESAWEEWKLCCRVTHTLFSCVCMSAWPCIIMCYHVHELGL